MFTDRIHGRKPQGFVPCRELLRLRLDQLWQVFKPKLDIAKQLGREICRSQLAFQGKR
jgi:hypothetical protein